MNGGVHHQRIALQQRYVAKVLPILVEEEDENMENMGEAFQGPPLVEMPNDNDNPWTRSPRTERPQGNTLPLIEPAKVLTWAMIMRKHMKMGSGRVRVRSPLSSKVGVRPQK